MSGGKREIYKDVGKETGGKEMTKKEFATFAMALKTYYPRETLLPNDASMELWFNQLKDIPYDVAEISLNKWVSLNKWSPSIADIREMSSTVTMGESPEWGEAWEQVLRAIRRYGSYNVAQALDSMDDLTRRTVERLGFREICMSENIAVDRANFRMVYENLQNRQKENNKLSLELKKRLQMIAGADQKLLEDKND